MSQALKKARLEAKITEEQKALLVEAAKRTIEEHQVIQLSRRDRQFFVETLLNPPPLSPQDALYRIKRIYQMSHVCLLSTSVNLFEGWMNLVESHPVTDGKIFDILHIAIMLSHGIQSIYTFNADDFIWCNEIEVIEPSCSSSTSRQEGKIIR